MIAPETQKADLVRPRQRLAVLTGHEDLAVVAGFKAVGQRALVMRGESEGMRASKAHLADETHRGVRGGEVGGCLGFGVWCDCWSVLEVRRY